jgi:hypothetical protein
MTSCTGKSTTAVLASPLERSRCAARCTSRIGEFDFVARHQGWSTRRLFGADE